MAPDSSQITRYLPRLLSSHPTRCQKAELGFPFARQPAGTRSFQEWSRASINLPGGKGLLLGSLCWMGEYLLGHRGEQEAEHTADPR